jgi:cobalamin-dependent methionine synthase I
MKVTHIVSVLERLVDLGVHVMVVEGHEERVGDDAQRHEEVHERVEDDQREELKVK